MYLIIAWFIILLLAYRSYNLPSECILELDIKVYYVMFSNQIDRKISVPFYATNLSHNITSSYEMVYSWMLKLSDCMTIPILHLGLCDCQRGPTGRYPYLCTTQENADSYSGAEINFQTRHSQKSPCELFLRSLENLPVVLNTKKPCRSRKTYLTYLRSPHIVTRHKSLLLFCSRCLFMWWD